MDKLKNKHNSDDKPDQSNWYDSDFAAVIGLGFIFFSIFAGIALIMYIGNGK